MQFPLNGPLLLATLTLAAAACSSSTGSTTSTSGTGGGGSYSVSPTTLSFQATADNPAPPPQSVQVSVQGTVYLMTSFSGTAVASATVIADGGASGSAAITVIPPAAAGTLTDRVEIIGCEDSLCMFKLADSPQLVDVTYNIALGGLAAAPSVELNFLETIGEAPASQNIELSDIAGASYPWVGSISYDTLSQSGWLSIAPDGESSLPQTVAAQVAAATSPGVRTATLAFSKPTASFAISPVRVVDVANLPTVGITVQPGSVAVNSARGTAPANETLTVSDLDGGSYSWIIAVEPLPNEAEGIISAAPLSGDALPATVTLSFSPMGVIGTNSEVLHFSGNGSDVRVLISDQSN